jgi:hypothetical protein
VAHVYAAGLQAPQNSGDETIRRAQAGRDVDAFLEKLSSLGS